MRWKSAVVRASGIVVSHVRREAGPFVSASSSSSMGSTSLMTMMMMMMMVRRRCFQPSPLTVELPGFVVRGLPFSSRGSGGEGSEEGLDVGGPPEGFEYSKVLKRVEKLVAKYNQLLEKANAQSGDVGQIHEEIGKLHPTVERVERLEELRAEHGSVSDIASDAAEDEEMKSMAREEVASLEHEILGLEFEIVKDVVPKPQETSRELLLEIRAGTGGEEAALFALDLLQMYQKFAQRKGWRFEVLRQDESEHGGYREVIVEISGEECYSQMQFESGIHRVQRVPKTEAGGRVHTSASSVAVMPQATEVELNVKDSDLKVETYRSGGAGGQHVNTTDSAVRITHLPSQVSVAIQDDRSQHKNRAKAMKILLAKLYEEEMRKRNAVLAEKRKSQIGSGDRSERIRTYNFPQGRVTDHRVNVTLHSLDQVLAGVDLDVFVEALERQWVLDYLENDEGDED
ncbi:peptide chain release factor [Chloropicon primus]|nr:peptide chain release factor [Chloropicon primus]